MVEHPTPLGEHTPKPTRTRRWSNRLTVALIALNLCFLLSMVGAFSPVFSPLIYPRLAPAGWHNITPHGNIILNDFAVSTTTPGLAAACATSFSIDVRDPSTWIPGGFRFWLSRDGGASWQGVHPPLPGGGACEITLGLDGSAGFTMDYGDIRNGQWASTSTWVTRDFGTSWHRPAPTPTVLVDGQSAPVTPLLPRAGIWYGLYDTHDPYSDKALAVSSDNGASWQPLSTTPSALVKQGWRAFGYYEPDHQIAPDYRDDHSWYRTVYKDNQGPVLEHSTDDGQSWAAVGPIGIASDGYIALAANPAQPDRLCADAPVGPNGPADLLDLRASDDGGQTWRQGSIPATYLDTVGRTSFGPVMDAQGSCYIGYLYGRGGPPYEDDHGSYCAVMRLPPGADTLQALSLGGYCGLPNGDLVDLTYVPTGNGMSGRLVTRGSFAVGGWHTLAAFPAGETDDEKVIWMAVP